MLQLKESKNCVSCGKPVKGRSDKKFCDDYCRAAYNNDLKSAANNNIRNVNNALGKNRRILETLLPEGEATAKANKDKLIEKGFQFKYHTNLYKAKNGNTYFYCYEYGYLPLENNWYLIVKREEE
jgi:predicted nucleic acid-binding Zn ribbon protein